MVEVTRRAIDGSQLLIASAEIDLKGGFTSSVQLSAHDTVVEIHASDRGYGQAIIDEFTASDHYSFDESYSAAGGSVRMAYHLSVVPGTAQTVTQRVVIWEGKATSMMFPIGGPSVPELGLAILDSLSLTEHDDGLEALPTGADAAYVSPPSVAWYLGDIGLLELTQRRAESIEEAFPQVAVSDAVTTRAGQVVELTADDHDVAPIRHAFGLLGEDVQGLVFSVPGASTAQVINGLDRLDVVSWRTPVPESSPL
jgi:hypothetical protein